LPPRSAPGEVRLSSEAERGRKAYFSKAAAAAAPDVAADMRKVGAGTADAAAIARLSKTPLYNSLMRTTCVATMLEGGHAKTRYHRLPRPR
jgi:hypothetical protein